MKTEIEEIKQWIIDNAGQLANDLARSLNRKPRHVNWLNGNKTKLDEMLRSGVPQKDIAAEFDVAPTTISHYAHNRSTHLRQDRASLAKRDRDLLRMQNTGGFSMREIGNSFGISRQRVHQILQTHGAL